MSNSLAEQMNKWSAQRGQRLLVGDDLRQPREIDHVAYFRSKSESRAAAQKFEANGFKVALTLGFLRSRMEASRVESLTDADVVRFLEQVLAHVEANGGTYDGFGGTVVPGHAGD